MLIILLFFIICLLLSFKVVVFQTVVVYLFPLRSRICSSGARRSNAAVYFRRLLPHRRPGLSLGDLELITEFRGSSVSSAGL